MKVLRYFRVAVESISAHKMSSMLTMLGIIIGVGAVLVTVGSGAAADTTARIESGGTNLLTVSDGSSRGVSGSATLSVADADALADTESYPDIRAVAPQYSSNTMVIYGTTEGSYQTVGTTANYAELTNKTVVNGTFFTEEQVEPNASVVVLGSSVATDLFGTTEPVGKSVRIDNTLFQVIGVLEESGGSGFGSSDSQVFVPLEVALGRLFNVDRYRGSYTISTISVQVVSSDRIDAVEVQIEPLLRLRHRLGSDERLIFSGGPVCARPSGAPTASGSSSATPTSTTSVMKWAGRV